MDVTRTAAWAQAERAARSAIEAQRAAGGLAPRTASDVHDAADALRDRLVIQGARSRTARTADQCSGSASRPALGKRKVDAVKTEDVERLARASLAKGLAPTTVRNTMTFLHSIPAPAVHGVRRRPSRR
jgi:hypothetical protein